jgi:hypothetical protein
MDRNGTKRSTLRGVTAVIALYAFVLQAFLGGLLPAPAMGAFGVICAEATGTIPGEDQPGKPHPVQHAACCAAAHVAPDVAAPAVAGTTIAWPVRAALHVGRPTEIRVAARAPPGSIAHPRGPPTV